MPEPHDPHQPQTVPSRPALIGEARASRPGPGPVRRLCAAVAAVLIVSAVVGWAGMPAAGAAGSTVDVATSAGVGSILTDAQGFALYTFSMDHGGVSSCTGSCATVWPALTVPAGTTPTAGPGVTGTVAAVPQANGTTQVTYNGSPLYTFLTDPGPGQVTGDGVGGFSVVKVAAAPTTPTSSPAGSTPTTTPVVPSPTTPTAAQTPSSTTGTSSPKSAPAPAPTAPASGSSAPASAPVVAPASGSSSSSPSSAPAALAFTGPGPALTWMAIVGAGLVALSLGVLAAVGDGSRRRSTARAATRAGSWLLGR